MRKAILIASLFGSFIAADAPAAGPSTEPTTMSQTTRPTAVGPQEMQRVFDEVKTPFKYGIVLRGEGGKKIDCPNIFRRDDAWWMVYVVMNEVGYETHLAKSNDLLHWTPLGKILGFRPEGWDKWQADGSVALVDYTWGGSSAIEPFDGKYWISYIGGALQGYEPDPLAIGMAWSIDPTKVAEWNRIHANPVLSREQPDVREFERLTLYKSTIIRDPEKRLGAPLVMYYNAKNKNGFERIGMAVSDDMVHWKRYLDQHVVAHGEEVKNGLAADPQIVKIDDLWVMFYFSHGGNVPKRTQAWDTFAVSKDMVTWTKWDGPHLVEPTEPWDKDYAHKPWVIKHDGVVYHFYCAVGTEGRVIALATSKDLKGK